MSLIDSWLASARNLPYDDITGAAWHRDVMEWTSKKSMSSARGSRRGSEGDDWNSRVWVARARR